MAQLHTSCVSERQMVGGLKTKAKLCSSAKLAVLLVKGCSCKSPMSLPTLYLLIIQFGLGLFLDLHIMVVGLTSFESHYFFCRQALIFLDLNLNRQVWTMYHFVFL